MLFHQDRSYLWIPYYKKSYNTLKLKKILWKTFNLSSCLIYRFIMFCLLYHKIYKTQFADAYKSSHVRPVCDVWRVKQQKGTEVSQKENWCSSSEHFPGWSLEYLPGDSFQQKQAGDWWLQPVLPTVLHIRWDTVWGESLRQSTLLLSSLCRD